MKKLVKSLIAAAGGLLGFVYLTYPSASILELIPDALPFVGSLDEAAASTLLIWALAYFGLDVTKFFRSKQPDTQKTAKVIDAEEVPTKDA